MKSILIRTTLAVNLWFVASPIFGATIIQDRFTWDATISFFDPIGQTFIAEEAALRSIAFSFGINNPASPNSPITMTLYLGSGFDGPIVDSVTRTVQVSGVGLPLFYDFDFSGNDLLVGTTYTAAVTTSSPRIGVLYNSVGDAYLNGQALESDATGNLEGLTPDLRFRITSVPEPSTIAILILGGLLFFLRPWSRRQS
jgi:hypothetical protein